MATTNNAINVSPTPTPALTWVTVVSISPDIVFPCVPLHGYITNETVIDNLPIFFTVLTSSTRWRLGDKSRIMSYGAGCIGFNLNRIGSQKIWYNGEWGIGISANPSAAVSITITCINASVFDAEEFIIEVGTAAPGVINLSPPPIL